MQLRQAGSNRTLLSLADGTVVLFSYETPVAAFVPERGYIRTDKYHSVTTSRHINEFVKDCDVVPQSEIDSLVA